MNAVRQLKAEIERIADQKRAKLLQRYFKTGKGEYGEGDIFLGITVPQSRKIAIKFEILILLQLKNYYIQSCTKKD